jgi:hypothetical protein
VKSDQCGAGQDEPADLEKNIDCSLRYVFNAVHLSHPLMLLTRELPMLFASPSRLIEKMQGNIIAESKVMM